MGQVAALFCLLPYQMANQSSSKVTHLILSLRFDNIPLFQNNSSDIKDIQCSSANLTSVATRLPSGPPSSHPAHPSRTLWLTDVSPLKLTDNAGVLKVLMVLPSHPLPPSSCLVSSGI